MEQTFGEYLRKLREERRLSLRKFCLASGADPSYHSKIENGLVDPPRDAGRFASYIDALGLTEESLEARELARLSSLDRGEIPDVIRRDPLLMGKMPVLFRTLEEGRLTEAVFDRVVRAIKEG